MLDWLKANVEATRKILQEEVLRFRNRDFMRAIVSGCGLVASADGTISPEEQQQMIEYIGQSNELSVFSTEQVLDYFNQVAEQLSLDYELGKHQAMQIIGRLSNDEEASRIMIRVCCAIGASDGDFDQNERRVVREICEVLSLNPSEFDL